MNRKIIIRRFVKLTIFFDRSRRYLSFIQTIVVLAMSLKIFGLPKTWYILLIPVVIVASIIVGYFDTRWGIREEENRNNTEQNPQIRKIIDLLEKLNRE